MTDFERRLTETLEAEADATPDPTGLAAGARERARRRARRRAVGGVVAVVLAVAVVPVAVAVTQGDGRRGPAVVDTPYLEIMPDLGPEGRLETYRNLEIQVPTSWGYGNLSTWCLSGGTEPGPPVVERPEGASPSIGCVAPQNGYGAQFFSTALFDAVNDDLSTAWRYGWKPGQVKVYPRGSWMGVVMEGDYAVRVVAPDQATAQRVLDSVRTIDGADSNGCAVSRDETGPAIAAGTVAVCRYGADRVLEQSELLTGSDAASAAAAVRNAPVDQSGEQVCHATPVEPYGAVLLREPGRDVTVVVGSSCDVDNGVSIGDERRLLSQDVVYWALSPGWSGAFYGDVPVPEHLRR